MKKEFKKFLLTLIICFSCCISTTAETHTNTPTKPKGILSSSFEQVKAWRHSYKLQLQNKYFLEQIKKTPNNVNLIETYAKYLKDHHNYDESIKYYNRLIELTKKDIYKKDIEEIKSIRNNQKKEKLFTDYITKAKKYESESQITKANEYYLKAQKIFPKRYESEFGLAKTYCWLNQGTLSTKKYRQLLKQAPDNIDLLAAYAKCLAGNKDYSHATEIYKKLFSITKDEKYKKDLQDIITLQKGYTPKVKNAELTHNLGQDNVFLDYLKKAQTYESQGKIAKANEYYLKAQKEAPNRFEAKFGLAKTYGWLHKNKLALEYYNNLLKEAPKNQDLITAYNKFLKENITKKIPAAKVKKNYPAQNITMEKDKTFSNYIKEAQAYESQGNAAKANEYYILASKIYPFRYEVKFGLAKTYGWLHNDEVALKYYQELLTQTPDSEDLLAAYANYLKDTKKYNEAMKVYNKLLTKAKLEKGVQHEKYKANIAELFFLQKDYLTSLNMYFEIYNQNPNNHEIQKAIALNYFASGDFEKSIDYYQKYLAQNCDAESLLNYGKSLFYSKQIQPAKEILERFVNIYPNNVDGLSTLADIYVATKETPKAIGIINRALLLEPNNTKVLIQTAKVDIAIKDYCTAQNILLNLLAIEPDNIEVKENLGDISFYTEDFGQALKYYFCIPECNKNPRLIYKIAQSYHYGKNYEVAQALYKELLNDPEYSNKAKIGLAEIQITKDKPLKARKILCNVLKADPCNIQAKKNLAITYYSTGDNLKSIKILETLPNDDSDINYNLAKAYNAIDRKDIALNLLNGNPQENAKTLKGEIKMQVRPAIEPLYNFFYMTTPDGNANAGMYQKAGGNGYLYIKPNLRAVGTITTTNYRNVTNIVSTMGTLAQVGLEGKPTNHIDFRSAIGLEAFSNNGNIIVGNALVKVSPNDVVSITSGYIRSLDEIDSYMSAAGVVPTTGPFANQLVGRIIDNKYVIANVGFKLPHKYYAYWGLNIGNKGGANSPNNSYKEIPAGFGKVIYSAAENKPINQALLGYDFYYTAYTNDRSGFGGANLNYSPIGSDGLATDPSSGFPGVGGYFSPTFFIANKIPLTIKGSFRESKLKYVASGFIGTQSIQGQIGLLGPGAGNRNSIRTTPYFGYSIGLRYNEKGKYGWAFDYIFNNYMTVSQHLLKLSLLIRF